MHIVKSQMLKNYVLLDFWATKQLPPPRQPDVATCLWLL